MQIDRRFINACMTEKPERLSDAELKACINTLLFNPLAQKELGATDRESLNIVVLRSKAHHFKFLEGYTSWKSVGSWREVTPEGIIIKEYPEEKNVNIEIEFKDRPDEKIGKRLMELFTEFNRRFVKEQLLYVHTKPIEESTLP